MVAGCSVTPKKFRMQPSSSKVMAMVFWGDAKGILLVDYMPLKATTTGEYFANVVHQFREAIKKKRHGLC